MHLSDTLISRRAGLWAVEAVLRLGGACEEIVVDCPCLIESRAKSFSGHIPVTIQTNNYNNILLPYVYC